MEKEEISIMDLIIETHVGLNRQGPGSDDMTLKAICFMESFNRNSRVLDLGCGTGGQTRLLADFIPGDIIGVDLIPEFINEFNDRAKRFNLQDRVKGIVGSMDDLSCENEEFDLIWSEGAIDNIGFQKGLSYWNGFLKKNGYIAVTSPSWLTNKRPTEVEKFWLSEGSELATIEDNISIMLKEGYAFISAFTLPVTCWTDNYFIPRNWEGKQLLEKYPGNKTVEDYVKNDEYEAELYSKYYQDYGYVFYIGQKL